MDAVAEVPCVIKALPPWKVPIHIASRNMRVDNRSGTVEDAMTELEEFELMEGEE